METHNTSNNVWTYKNTTNSSMTSLSTVQNKWNPTFLKSMSPEKHFYFP